MNGGAGAHDYDTGAYQGRCQCASHKSTETKDSTDAGAHRAERKTSNAIVHKKGQSADREELRCIGLRNVGAGMHLKGASAGASVERGGKTAQIKKRMMVKMTIR